MEPGSKKVRRGGSISEIEASADVNGQVGYAMCRSSARIVNSISARNLGSSAIGELRIKITSEPPFLEGTEYVFNDVKPGEVIDADNDSVLIDRDLLANVSEDMEGYVRVEAYADGIKVSAQDHPVTVLPHNMWPGYRIGGMISAFVDPDSHTVCQILSDASGKLREAGGKGISYGYGEEERNRKVISAIRLAIRDMGIEISEPEEGWQNEGQAMRTATEIDTVREATTAEMAALFASALESAGLGPVIVFADGEVHIGVWTVDRTFPDAVVYDEQMFRAPAERGEMMLFDIRSLYGSEPLTEPEADFTISDFHHAVDVLRSRGIIDPMPPRAFVDGMWEADDYISRTPEKAICRAYSKRDQWERKLLDISVKNNLISLRKTQRVLPLMLGEMTGSLSKILGNEEMTFRGRPDGWSGEDVFGRIPFESSAYIENAAGAVRESLGKGEITAPVPEKELERAITFLYRTSKKALEEDGANSLFLAAGALKWFDGDTAHYAPLVLIPVSIDRKVSKGYFLSRRDEDIAFNVTIGEKLRTEHGIDIEHVYGMVSDEVPDMKRIMRSVRESVRGMPGWDVVDSACLGIFSFDQFVMWNDLRAMGDGICDNKIVNSLVRSRLSWDAREIDDSADPSGLCLTVPADASQIRAVRASGDGQSFVLHGPPGTGKSQTITNIISNSLHEGKTVLFVAEKMAALEVVQRRLNEIGIDNHCLELHSNKTEKRKVLDHLGRALERSRTVDPEEQAAKTAQMESARKELDRYVSALYAKQPSGLSIAEAIDRYESYRDASLYDIELDPSLLFEAGPEDIRKWMAAVGRMERSRRNLAGCPAYPFSLIGCTDTSLSLTSEAGTVLRKLANNSRSLIAMNAEAESLGIPIDIRDAEGLITLMEDIESADMGMMMNSRIRDILWISSELTEALEKSDSLMKEMTRAAVESTSRISERITASVTRIDTARTAILGSGYSGDLSAVDRRIEDLLFMRGISDEAAAGFSASKIYWKPYMIEFNKENDISSRWSAAKDAPLLRRSRAKRQFMESILPMLIDPRTKFRKVPRALRSVDVAIEKTRLLRQLAESRLSGEGYRMLKEQTRRIREYGRFADRHIPVIERYGGDPGKVAELFGKLRDAEGLSRELTGVSREFKENRARARELLSLESELSSPEECLRFCDAALSSIGRLPDWTRWKSACAEAGKLGLFSVTETAERREGVKLEDSFAKSLYRSIARRGIADSDDLRSFNGDNFELFVSEFRRMDSEWGRINREVLKLRLQENVPSKLDTSAEGSETNILYRALTAQRTRKSLRTLFGEIPNLLQRICPCMLMSPLSVAQYLEPGRFRFDIVIFDEASQIPTHKAINALARGENAVIAGDPKQLPPTTFFESRIEDGDENTEDMESFLEDCLALPMPGTHLEWHYRSRHESLIAFSNRTYYGNRMLTFPSPDDMETKVSLRLVEGIYGRGGTRTNEAEAKAVTDEIIRRLRDPETRGRSIGVVAFNKSQQEMIDDLLWSAIKDDDELYRAATEGNEPVFVKNLENVQGDERDVILFSVGYGPDSKGRVSSNFGPINKPGGGRRLNVAVSRARREMVVFSSMSSDMIRTEATTPDGVRQMKSFLEYAENSGRFRGTEQKPQMSALAGSIAEALNENGYETHFGIGNSGFRIDVAVIDPAKRNRYMLGILTDGDGYADSKNTRDREFARADVLRDLGWNIERVWSVEWFYNPEGTTERLLRALDDIRRGRTRDQTTVTDYEPQYAETVSDDTAERFSAAEIEPRIISFEEALSNEVSIANAAYGILAEEAPVTEGRLVRRIAEAFDINRLTPKSREAILDVLGRSCTNTTLPGRERTYWSRVQSPSEYRSYRTPDSVSERRSIEEIPTEEAANAVVAVAESSIVANEANILKTAAKELGFPRIGARINAVMSEGLELAVRQGRVIRGNGTVRFKKR
jgi:DNA polymerase III delta prime subunit